MQEPPEALVAVKRLVAKAGLVISAVGVFYSGLMFLQVVPAPLSIRFWDGGQGALSVAAILDIACGSVLFYLTAQVLLEREVQRHARHALLVCVLAMIADWIGGLYGISALIGLVSSYCLIREQGWRSL